LSKEKGIITIYKFLLRTNKFVTAMQYDFKIIIVRRDASLRLKMLARDRHFNVESKTAIMQYGLDGLLWMWSTPAHGPPDGHTVHHGLSTYETIFVLHVFG
jgi:hypothetical protein